LACALSLLEIWP